MSFVKSIQIYVTWKVVNGRQHTTWYNYHFRSLPFSNQCFICKILQLFVLFNVYTYTYTQVHKYRYIYVRYCIQDVDARPIWGPTQAPFMTVVYLRAKVEGKRAIRRVAYHHDPSCWVRSTYARHLYGMSMGNGKYHRGLMGNHHLVIRQPTFCNHFYFILSL